MSNLALATQWLDESRPSFEEMNLDSLSFNKEKEFMIQAFQANPYLLKMEPNSVRNILVNCALTGISLNPAMKMAYPVPRKGKLCLDISYVGLVKILTDTGSVVSIRAKIVYSNEPFDIELGSGGFVKHKPFFGKGGKGEPLGCYSLAVLNDGSEHIHWMYHEEIIGIMNRSEAVKSGKANPWQSDFSQMAQKTVIKQHFKYLPKSERAEMAANAIDIDHETNGIDFKKEQQERKAQSPGAVSIDVLMPDVEEDRAAFEAFKAKFETEVLPEEIKTDKATINVSETIANLESDFEEGALTKGKFEKWNSFITKQVEYFTAQSKNKGNAQEEEFE